MLRPQLLHGSGKDQPQATAALRYWHLQTDDCNRIRSITAGLREQSEWDSMQGHKAAGIMTSLEGTHMLNLVSNPAI